MNVLVARTRNHPYLAAFGLNLGQQRRLFLGRPLPTPLDPRHDLHIRHHPLLLELQKEPPAECKISHHQRRRYTSQTGRLRPGHGDNDAPRRPPGRHGKVHGRSHAACHWLAGNRGNGHRRDRYVRDLGFVRRQSTKLSWLARARFIPRFAGLSRRPRRAVA